MDVPPENGFRQSPAWLLVLTVIVLGQAWLTYRLFGGEAAFVRLTNDQHIVDGRHPLHYYHGMLGHRSFHERSTMTCYDPAFQAGYLKTPIFDAGSRPAELFFLIGGISPASYKLGIAFCCLLAPLAFALAGRGAGLGAGGSCLAALIGGTLWWSPPCRALLDAGDIDLLAGGICAPVYLTWLARYGRSPGPFEWIVLTISSAFGWYMQPLLMIGLVPMSLIFHIYILWHRRFAWHLGLLFANAAGLLVNGFWLWEWASHVWMYVPFGGGEIPPALWPSGLREWEAFLPGDPVDLGVGILGLIGFFVMLRRHAGPAWMLAFGMLIFVLAGGAGRLWPVMAEFGTQKLMSVGVWCCAVPAAFCMSAIAGGFGRSIWGRMLGLLWLGVGLAGLTIGFDLPSRYQIPAIDVGLGAGREEIIKTIRESSTPEGRILWEDRAASHRTAGWSSLLAELTQRQYLGGLTPDGCLDYLHARLIDGKLAGKPIAEWSDGELDQFFDRYNVMRIVAWTQPAMDRFQKYPRARQIAAFQDAGAGAMYALDRRASFFLKGKGVVTQMDWKRIALADLEPDENGIVVLSLHYHQSWRIAPTYVQLERDKDVNDPISMLRFKLPGPVARMTLTWRGE